MHATAEGLFSASRYTDGHILVLAEAIYDVDVVRGAVFDAQVLCLGISATIETPILIRALVASSLSLSMHICIAFVSICFCLIKV